MYCPRALLKLPRSRRDFFFFALRTALSVAKILRGTTPAITSRTPVGASGMREQTCPLRHTSAQSLFPKPLLGEVRGPTCCLPGLLQNRLISNLHQACFRRISSMFAAEILPLPKPNRTRRQRWPSQSVNGTTARLICAPATCAAGAGCEWGRYGFHAWTKEIVLSAWSHTEGRDVAHMGP